MKTRLFQNRTLSMLIMMVLVSVLTLALNYGASASTATGCQPTITVTSNGDSGPGTLRQAILDVCIGGIIDFDLPLPTTITLTSGQLLVDKAMTIDGLGPDLLAIKSGSYSRVLKNEAEGLILNGVTIQDGFLSGGGKGAGILNTGTMTINNCAIKDNVFYSEGLSSAGGGIANQGGTLVVNDSSITQNEVDSSAWGGSIGGGIYTQGGLVTINNSTISDNGVYVGVSGGGIAVSSGIAIVKNSTITDNYANSSGGIYNGGFLFLQNSIVAQNAHKECDGGGQFISLGHNLSDTEECHLDGPGDLPNSDPLLGPLQNNGGSTFNHALLPGSPAIDAAAFPGCPTADQRGVSRPQGSYCDIGAFEAVYETMALAHQYWMNDGSSGSGVFSLLTDGSFTDDVGGTGAWSLLPTPPRVLLQYDAGFACDALLAGKFLTDNQVQGLRLCQDGSGVRGVWQATILD